MSPIGLPEVLKIIFYSKAAFFLEEEYFLKSSFNDLSVNSPLAGVCAVFFIW
jgi:hypothetical protein